MKKFFLFVFLISLSLVSPLFAQSDSFEDVIQKWLLSTNQNQNWIFAVDQYRFSADDFKKSYRLFVSNLPAQATQLQENDLKNRFLNQYINENLLVLTAFEDNLLKDPELQTLIKASLRETVYQYYLHKMAPKDQTLFLPTQEEFNRYYSANRDRFNAMGLNADQIKQVVNQEIAKLKIRQWMLTLIEQSREKHRIERNTNEMKKLGIK